VKSATLVILMVTLWGCHDGDTAGTLHNQAVAALRSGDLVAAEIAAEKAAARGGAAFEARRDFVLGNAAFARCEKDEFAAMGPRGAAAIEAAIGHAERARDFWRGAAAGRPDWPEARRNVERARIKLDALRLKRDELTPASPPPKPKPPPPRDRTVPRRPDDFTPAPRVQPQLEEIPTPDVLSLLEKLKAKEQDKNKVRRAQRQSGRYAVEKDW
jgi:hypothetical protein